MEGFFDDIKDGFFKNSRVEALRQLARENGFQFKNRENFATQDYLLKEFSIFKGKKDKRLKGILSKKEEALVVTSRIYDYWYFGDFKKRKTTVFEIFGEALEFPRFEIRPKGLLNQVTDFFVDKQKPFPEETDFHAKYEILTEDAGAFEAEIGPKGLNLLLDKKNISVEGDGDYLLVYYTYEELSVKEIMAIYEEVKELVEVLLVDDSNQYV